MLLAKPRGLCPFRPCFNYATCGAAFTWLIWVLLIVGLGLTAYYMVRLRGSGTRIVETVHLCFSQPSDGRCGHVSSSWPSKMHPEIFLCLVGLSLSFDDVHVHPTLLKDDRSDKSLLDFVKSADQFKLKIRKQTLAEEEVPLNNKTMNMSVPPSTEIIQIVGHTIMDELKEHAPKKKRRVVLRIFSRRGLGVTHLRFSSPYPLLVFYPRLGGVEFQTHHASMRIVMPSRSGPDDEVAAPRIDDIAVASVRGCRDSCPEVQVGGEVVELDARIADVRRDMDNDLYPHMFTAIVGRRSMPCKVIYLAINKGIQEGLEAGIEHGRSGRTLAKVEAYNPRVKDEFVYAVIDFENVSFTLLDELELLKHSPLVSVMFALVLKDAQECRSVNDEMLLSKVIPTACAATVRRGLCPPPLGETSSSPPPHGSSLCVADYQVSTFVLSDDERSTN
nr:hypothetical protein [Tanacetum cinerariifolium]